MKATVDVVEAKIIPEPAPGDIVLLITPKSDGSDYQLDDLLRRRYPGVTFVWASPGYDLTTVSEGTMRQLGWIRKP